MVAQGHGSEAGDNHGVTIMSAEPGDLEAVESLLLACGLPVDGVRDHFKDFLVALAPSAAGVREIVGCAAIERYGATCVFRSLAVTPDHRGAGLGRRLMEAALARAAALGCDEVFLLTRTIEQMASHKGFERIERDQVQAAPRASLEFSINACATAIVMRRRL